MPLPLSAEIKVVRQHTHLIFIFKEHYKTFCFKVDKTLHENLCSHILPSFSWRVNITYEESEIYISFLCENIKLKGSQGLSETEGWGCIVEEVILIEKMSQSLVRTQRSGFDVVMSAEREISPQAIIQRDLEHSAHLYSQRWPPGIPRQKRANKYPFKIS